MEEEEERERTMTTTMVGEAGGGRVRIREGDSARLSRSKVGRQCQDVSVDRAREEGGGKIGRRCQIPRNMNLYGGQAMNIPSNVAGGTQPC